MSHPLRIPSAVSLACALLLAACGGGDGATDSTAKSEVPAPEQPLPPAASDLTAPYVGSWKGGCTLATDQEASWSGQYTFTRLSDTKATYRFVKETFTSVDCSGDVDGTLSTDGEVSWSGKTRTVSGVAADEVLFDPMNSKMSGNMTAIGNLTAQFKQVLALSAHELREGDRTHLDSDGYPVGFSAIRYTDGVPAAPPPSGVAPPPPPPAPEAQ